MLSVLTIATPFNAACVRPQEEAHGCLGPKRAPACDSRMLLLLLASCIQGADTAAPSPSPADHLAVASESGTTQVAIRDAAGAQAVIYALRDQIHVLKAENQQIDALKAQVQ